MTPLLRFEVGEAEAEPHSITPRVQLKLRVFNERVDCEVQSILLRCQTRIEPKRRSYSETEELGLLGLFGTRERWSTTQSGFVWNNQTINVAGFRNDTTVDVPLDCTYDLSVRWGHYMSEIREGDVPLALLFSGSVFFYDSEGALRTAPLSWTNETKTRLPVALIHEALDRVYSGYAGMLLSKSTYSELNSLRKSSNSATFDECIGHLLAYYRENMN